MDDKQQLLTQISSYVGKLLRDHFGKGPESVYVSLGSTFFTLYIRNFITPMERVLLEQEQEMVVLDLRHQLMKKVLPELCAYIERTTGQTIREMYYDWSLYNRSGLIGGIAETPFPAGDEVDESYPGRDDVHRVINQVSQEVQKRPEETYSCLLNSRTLLILRRGILVRIEQELIRLGHGELLRHVKANLEQSELRDGRFDSILQQRVIDSFVDWDFTLDKSMIVLILQPKK